MDITFLGQAGLYIETQEGSILCDPWFNPAYFAGWWPFPANDHIDPARIGQPTYLYVSHMHQDHLDPEFLRENVDKSATVLLPAYPLPALEETLRSIGFTRFIAPADGEIVHLGEHLRVAMRAYTAPADGPLGDSCLFVDDGTTRILNLNDAHPRDIDALAAWGPFDGLFLQFSGAIWYPVVYELPEQVMADLGRAKRRNEMQRAETFIRQLAPRHVFPSAGPPCFLDPELFEFNDLENSDTNPFPDQPVFLKLLQEHGLGQGHLVLPGTAIHIDPSTCETTHAIDGESVSSIFEHKRDYLRRYQARIMPRLRREMANLPEPGPGLYDALRARLEPIMAVADLTARQIDGLLVLDWGEQAAALDFRRRRIRPWDGAPARYYFRVDARALAACVEWGLVDWVNSLFLSFRFRARRDGEYNEAVYTFFKCLSPERIQYAEGYGMEAAAEMELWQCGDYLVQRRCPHLKADLERFAIVDEQGILTCQMHGWQFDLATGKCLNADDRVLYRRPIVPSDPKVSERR
jgi:UDP-MurNAc hydroxylase